MAQKSSKMVSAAAGPQYFVPVHLLSSAPEIPDFLLEKNVLLVIGPDHEGPNPKIDLEHIGVLGTSLGEWTVVPAE